MKTLPMVDAGASTPIMPRRVIAYIDGFNLYFGMKELNFQRYYWLNLQKLIETYLAPDQILIKVKYFSSDIVTSNTRKKKRQEAYFNALSTLNNFEIIKGRYFCNTKDCDIYDILRDGCGGVYDNSAEKMTDVNIALSIVLDSIGDLFDVAILVSGDMDLYPAVKFVRDQYPTKSISVFFPPARENIEFGKIASGKLTIGRKRLKESQFPDVLHNKIGDIINRPVEWV